MLDYMLLSSSALAGLGLGALYFTSLRLTVDRLTTTPHPARWLLASLGLRMLVLLSGLYVVMSLGGLTALLVATAGVIAGRGLCVRGALQRLRKRESAA